MLAQMLAHFSAIKTTKTTTCSISHAFFLGVSLRSSVSPH